jgi:hypothetical protein
MDTYKARRILIHSQHCWLADIGNFREEERKEIRELTYTTLPLSCTNGSDLGLYYQEPLS